MPVRLARLVALLALLALLAVHRGRPEGRPRWATHADLRQGRRLLL
jgi:hypothetical protein